MHCASRPAADAAIAGGVLRCVAGCGPHGRASSSLFREEHQRPVDGFLTRVSPGVRHECGAHREAVGEPAGGGEGAAAESPDVSGGGEP